jgi:hypothetical protein
MANEFRTVEYQGSRSERQAYLQAPDASRGLEVNAEYNQRSLAAGQEGINQINQLAARNNERLDNIALDNQRVAMAQQSTRNELALRASQMIGQQRLDNMKLRDGWQSEIERIRLTHQTMRDELRLKISAQESEALTNLGAGIAQFSQTLWKQKAEETNKRNQELQSQGLMDELLGFGSTKLEDLSRVDQAQHMRLARQAEGQLVAQTLDQNGRPVDATRIRADNPFYLYGRQEGLILKAAGDLPSYLQKVVDEAQASGTLKKGDPNADIALGIILNTASRKFFVEKGLLEVPPAIAAKYMGDALLRTQASLVKQFNAENKAYVKETQERVALGEGLLAFETVGKDVNEATKVVSQIINLGGTDGLVKLFKSYGAQANMSGNRTPLDNLMQVPEMAFLAGEYAQWQQNWQETAARNADKANKEYADRIEGSFLSELTQVNPSQVPALREKYMELARTLPIDLAGPLLQKISKTTIADASSASTALNDLIETTPIAQLPAAIARFKADNPGLPNSVVQQADKALKSFEKSLSPEAQQLVEESKRAIVGLIDPKASAARKLDAGYDEKLKAVIRNRQDELERRAKTYWQRPGASADGFRNWLQQSNQDLIKAPIRPDENGNFPELTRGITVRPSSSAVPSLPRGNFNGRQLTFFTSAKAREKVLSGNYGRVNATTSLVLTPNEVIAGAANYEAGNGHLPVIQKLAARAGMTPEALLQTQAKLYNMPGRLEPPKEVRQTPAYLQGTDGGQRVSRDYARSFALSAKLSERGAIWLATNMMDESGGDPNTVHDNGTGFGLFGHRLERRDALVNYAKQRGLPPNDAQTQLEFAVWEMKNKYPSVWNIVTAPNPTLNQLWRASKAWEGFNKKHDNHRFNSLKNALGGQ